MTAISLQSARSLTAICAALPLAGEDDQVAPEWIHVLPRGEITTVDRRGPYRADDLDEIAKASLQASGGRLPVDENHAIDLSAPTGGPSPARGWIVELEARQDGLWGRMEWSKAGEALMADRAYRFLSPAFVHREDGTVVAVLRASLTNNPNLRQLAALNQEEGMDLLAKLREMFGLDETADEDALIAAITKLINDNKVAMQSAGTALAPIAEAVGLQADAGADAVLASVKALNDPAKMVPASQVATLQANFAELQTSVSRDKAVAAVDAAIAAGKPGVKPLRDHYIARHMKETAAVEKELAGLPTLTGETDLGGDPGAVDGKTGLHANESQVAKLMGIDPEKYAATKADEAAEA